MPNHAFYVNLFMRQYTSLIETAKMNGVNPHAYLKATLEAIAAGHPASDIDRLLPWAFTPISR